MDYSHTLPCDMRIVVNLENGRPRTVSPNVVLSFHSLVWSLARSGIAPSRFDDRTRHPFVGAQLGGAWGAGERLYRSGPWASGTATQGYQLPFTPAELFHTSLRAIIRDLGEHRTPFHEMSADNQDTYLKSLEAGALDLDGVPSSVFFDALLQMTVEGFFCDPVYGGNRDMVAWRMIGFPGAYADYFEAVDRQGMKFEREPMSLAEDGKRHIHPRKDIPANL